MMALDSVYHFFNQPLLDWDPQSFEIGEANDQFNAPAMEFPITSECLEDESEIVSSKRRRIYTTPSCFHDPLFATCDQIQDLNGVFQNFWDSSGFGEVGNDMNGIIQERSNLLLESLNIQPITGLHEGSDSFYSDSSNQENLPKHPIKNFTLPGNNEKIKKGNKRSRKFTMAILYPFTAVKPGGVEGCLTLHDINKKLVMRPARPVRHPVGEFAGVPRESASGTGLSGKEVVSLTRIYTRGKGGTITIIRTRG